MDKLTRMGLKGDQCQLHGDYNYNPSLCPLIDETNLFEVSISFVTLTTCSIGQELALHPTFATAELPN